MYLEIDEGYFEHTKTLRLCAALKDHHAAIYPIRLWKWACRSATDGNLGRVDAFVVEKVVGYEKMDGKCFAALCSPAAEHRSFLDVNEDGTVSIHGWSDFTGAAVKRMEEAAADKKAWRAHKAGKCERQSCRWCNDVKKTSDGRHMDSKNTVDGTSDTVQSSHATSSPDQPREESNPPARDPSTTSTEQGAQKIRPRTAYDLTHCLRVAIQREQPQNGPWNPGGSFAAKEAREFLDGFGDDLEEALETIEARIEIFAKDATMRPWTIAKFARAYNGISVGAPSGGSDFEALMEIKAENERIHERRAR